MIFIVSEKIDIGQVHFTIIQRFGKTKRYIVKYSGTLTYGWRSSVG